MSLIDAFNELGYLLSIDCPDRRFLGCFVFGVFVGFISPLV